MERKLFNEAENRATLSDVLDLIGNYYREDLETRSSTNTVGLSIQSPSTDIKCTTSSEYINSIADLHSNLGEFVGTSQLKRPARIQDRGRAFTISAPGYESERLGDELGYESNVKPNRMGLDFPSVPLYNQPEIGQIHRSSLLEAVATSDCTRVAQSLIDLYDGNARTMMNIKPGISASTTAISGNFSPAQLGNFYPVHSSTSDSGINQGVLVAKRNESSSAGEQISGCSSPLVSSADLNNDQPVFSRKPEKGSNDVRRFQRSMSCSAGSSGGGGTKLFPCKVCGKSFASASYLAQHNRIHLGIKPYKCDMCERSFTQLCHLQQHKRTHTGEKPYKCQHEGCMKSFSQLSNLRTHYRSHLTTALPVRCGSCHRCFADEKSLREHIPEHLNTKLVRKSICAACGKAYAQEAYLVRHMMRCRQRQMSDGDARSETLLEGEETAHTGSAEFPMDMGNTEEDISAVEKESKVFEHFTLSRSKSHNVEDGMHHDIDNDYSIPRLQNNVDGGFYADRFSQLEADSTGTSPEILQEMNNIALFRRSLSESGLGVGQSSMGRNRSEMPSLLPIVEGEGMIGMKDGNTLLGDSLSDSDGSMGCRSINFAPVYAGAIFSSISSERLSQEDRDRIALRNLLKLAHGLPIAERSLQNQRGTGSLHNVNSRMIRDGASETLTVPDSSSGYLALDAAAYSPENLNVLNHGEASHSMREIPLHSNMLQDTSAMDTQEANISRTLFERHRIRNIMGDESRVSNSNERRIPVSFESFDALSMSSEVQNAGRDLSVRAGGSQQGLAGRSGNEVVEGNYNIQHLNELSADDISMLINSYKNIQK